MFMKIMRRFNLFIMSLLISASSFAQDIEVTPALGYAFRSDLRFIEGKMQINDYFNFGINASFPSNTSSGRFELYLSNSFTHAKWKESEDHADLISETNYTMMVTYAQVSWVWETEVQRYFYLYGGPSTGLTNYKISSREIENMPRFSVGLQGGFKYYFNNVLGFRAHYHLILPVMMGSGTHFRGITDESGENSYLTVNSTTFPTNSILNFGVIFRFRTY